MFSFIFVCVVVLLAIVFTKLIGSSLKSDDEDKRKQTECSLLEARIKYNQQFENEQIPKGLDVIEIVSKPVEEVFQKGYYYIWKDNNNNLNLFPTDANENILNKITIKKITLALSNIEYFATKNEKGEMTTITEGTISGGGVNIKGTLIGAVIAGVPGAIIGSREKIKIDPIKTEVTSYAIKQLYINYIGFDLNRHSLFVNSGNYNILNKIIPEKRYISY